MAEHTGGEWVAEKRDWRGEPSEHKYYIVGGQFESEDDTLCAVGIAIVDGNKTSQGVTEANARLIAAAPKMLVYIPRMLINLYDDASVCEKLTEEFGVTPESAAAAVRAAWAGPYPEPQEPGETP